jgi:16S rRNA (uracil1498-N3)-methyltransferase
LGRGGDEKGDTVIECRFLVSPEALETSGEMVAVVRDEEHHHLSRVLRLRHGDAVSVFDGAGRGFRGTIESIAARETRVRLTGPDERAVEPSFQVVLAQGIPHHDRMDLVIQKTTEIGVGAIVPIISAHTVPRPGREGRWTRLERWRRVACEAARQSGRLRIPEIAEPVGWPQFVDGLSESGTQARLIFDPEADAVAGHAGITLGAAIRSALVAVGPEGGWSESETALGRDRGFVPLALGPRIMRTETAGIIGVAIILFLAGDLGRAGGPQIPLS